MSDALKKESSAWTLWIGVAVVFALMAMSWVAMFFFSNQNRVADVPLEKTEEVR